MWNLLSLFTVFFHLFSTVILDDFSNTTNSILPALNVTLTENDEGTIAAIDESANTSSNLSVVVSGGFYKKCAINEKFDWCPENRCQPQICEDVGIRLCSSHEEKYFYGREDIYQRIAFEKICEPPACVCIENHVRDAKGVCIHAKLCPSCGNDKNSTFGCGTNCGRRCSNYNKGPVECSETCNVNSCECKEGYVLDDFTGKCVLPEDCSNKDAPEPEGSEGAPDDGTSSSSEGASNDDPCSDCGEKNCDEEDTHANEIDGEISCGHHMEDKKCEKDDDENSTSEKPGSSTAKRETSITTTPKSDESQLGHNTTHKIFTRETHEPCKEEKCKTTEKIETTSEISTTTTKIPSTTKSPKECNSKNEEYVKCPPCPQISCSEYLNGARCPIKNDPMRKCMPECRCRSKFYKDSEGNCVSAWDCKKWARLTTTTTKKPKDPTTTIKPTTQAPTCEEVSSKLFVRANVAFSVKIVNELLILKPRSNVFYASASILFLIAQLAIMARSETKIQLLNTLNFNSTDQISCFMPKWYASVTAQHEHVQFRWFSLIYADEVCELSDQFIQITKTIFTRGAKNIDFSSLKSAEEICNSVEETTHVTNFIRTESLSTVEKSLIYVDAQSIAGHWENNFDPADTTERDFFFEGKAYKRSTMYQRATFLYTERLPGAKTLLLKFRKGRSQLQYNFLIFLPNARDGVHNVLKKLSNTDTVLSVYNNLRDEIVEVYIPKFTILASNKMKRSVASAGVDLIFNKTSTGLKDIAACENPIVGEIFQKTSISFHERGVGELETSDFPPEANESSRKSRRRYKFKADHPFIFWVIDNSFNVLHAGVLAR